MGTPNVAASKEKIVQQYEAGAKLAAPRQVQAGTVQATMAKTYAKDFAKAAETLQALEKTCGSEPAVIPWQHKGETPWLTRVSEYETCAQRFRTGIELYQQCLKSIFRNGVTGEVLFQGIQTLSCIDEVRFCVSRTLNEHTDLSKVPEFTCRFSSGTGGIMQ